MEKYYLAIDIGASGGRHMLGCVEKGKIKMEEIYRFSNGVVKKNGRLCWDTEKLFEEILIGMKKCSEIGKIPVSVGIDTWAVDFVLLDERGNMIGDAVSYRDSRTETIEQKVYDQIEEKDLYSRTGIQKQRFNTIYQLMAVREKDPEDLERAENFLMIPDYFHYLLTGKVTNEYTNATTTQLLDPVTKDWDWELIEKLGYPKRIFGKISEPGTKIGMLQEEIRKKVGFDCEVVLPATHDTASAVVAVPGSTEQTLYISSGTWSLLGTELMEADCSEKSYRYNFSNEGGYNYRFRYLKNIMGLWMIQNIRKELGKDKSFEEICQTAKIEIIPSIVDCNDDRFLSPDNMTEEVRNACRESGQQIPQSLGETAAVVYQSLAACYATAVSELEENLGKTFGCIHIVGGGANAGYLNELTAKACGKKVFAGPTEATAVGNLAVQMIAAKECEDLWDARQCIGESFPIQCFEYE